MWLIKIPNVALEGRVVLSIKVGKELDVNFQSLFLPVGPVWDDF
jgi:hypothetical protein